MELSKSYSSDNDVYEIGIDEAGRGPLMGRVYVGAVIWDDKLSSDLINDSKRDSNSMLSQSILSFTNYYLF